MVKRRSQFIATVTAAAGILVAGCTGPAATRSEASLTPVLAAPASPPANAAAAAPPTMNAPDQSVQPLAKTEPHPEMTCAMHRKMMAAMTPQELQAVISAHMRDMTPEMRTRYLERLQNCAAR